MPDETEFTMTSKPCPRADCQDGWNYDYNDYCGVCRGEGVIQFEVHSVCGLDENECKCFVEVKEKAA